MCGITGIVHKDAKKHGHGARVKKMTDCISHRGPDGDGIKTFEHCVLGHRRLSIVDIGGGAQPMMDQAETIAVVFNGEIYGFKDIKKELASSYPFQTSSDTEVILALYKTHGESFVEKLPGMFAFGLWDEQKGLFMAARDRFGEKPFYYAFGSQGEFIFASEIKAILASDLITPIISRESVAHYLHKLYVHPTKTIYENIHTLPPAHQLILKNGKIEIKRYWNQPKTEDITIEEALPRFTFLLQDAVRRQLVADVPIGAFLSGGLDSTTIVSIASTLSPKIKTFGFGYEGTKNELSFARLAAKKYGTEHYELHDKDYKIADLILEMASVYDEPIADSSNISTYLISKLTREHTKVVLSGDGGDELLAGYQGWNRPIMAMSDPNLKNFPGKTLFMRMLAQVALRRNWQKKTEVINKARGLYYRAHFSNTVDAHRTSNVFFRKDELKRLGLNVEINTPMPSWSISNTVDDAFREDLENYMPGDILVKTDRASMANSLELRAPFLDVPFAEFAISLPFNLKISENEEKVILRRAFEKDWPEEIRTRSKQGFGAPIEIWLEKPEVKTLIHEYLNDPKKKIFQYLSFEKTREYVEQKKYQLWILLTLSVWMEKHSFQS